MRTAPSPTLEMPARPAPTSPAIRSRSGLPYRDDDPVRRATELALAFKSFKHFVRLLWNTVEKKAFQDSFHIDAICEHLEAVTEGIIQQLIINIPPRCSKSLLVSVFWHPWEWLRKPETQWLRSSYAHDLSVRDNVKSRRLIQSALYQDLLMEFQPDFVLVGDQNTKIRYENSLGGYSLATSVDGALTGEGGDKILIDDPHNVREGESEAKRKSCLAWWDESMSTRLNNAITGSKVIIMQRVHEDDLTGHILKREPDEWDHLCLPMEYEGRNRVISTLGWQDPRTTDGELLSPARFGPTEVSKLKRSLGSYGTAGQLQQRPSPRGGGMIKVSLLRVISVLARSRIKRSIWYWDKAGTEGGGARTAGVLMHLLSTDMVVIEKVVKGQWSYPEREARIKQEAILTAALYGKHAFEIWTEQEPGSGGKESAERTVRNLRGFVAYKEPVRGDKALRARPFAAGVEAEMVCLLQGDWIQEYIDELEQFPAGRYRDQTDATSGAFNKINVLGEEETVVRVWGRSKEPHGPFAAMKAR